MADEQTQSSSNYARPWWALRTSTAYQGAKRIYKYTTSFPGTYCLARFGENTAEGALRLTGVKDRLQLEAPANAAGSSWFKRAPNMTSIDYNLEKGLSYVDSLIDNRLANPGTVEGKVLRVGTSVGLWVAERVPFGGVFVPVLETMDPDHQAPRIEFTSAPEVTETPSQTGKAKAQETADVEVTGEEDDETESTGGEDGEEPEDDATANEAAGGSDAGSGGGIAAAVSSSSLVSLTEPSEAGEKKGKRPKNKARRLLRSVGHSFKKAINFPKSPAATEEGALGQESGSSAPTKASHFPITPKATATPTPGSN